MLTVTIQLLVPWSRKDGQQQCGLQQPSVGSKGPKVYQENVLTITGQARIQAFLSNILDTANGANQNLVCSSTSPSIYNLFLLLCRVAGAIQRLNNPTIRFLDSEGKLGYQERTHAENLQAGIRTEDLLDAVQKPKFLNWLASSLLSSTKKIRFKIQG